MCVYTNTHRHKHICICVIFTGGSWNIKKVHTCMCVHVCVCVWYTNIYYILHMYILNIY